MQNFRLRFQISSQDWCFQQNHRIWLNHHHTNQPVPNKTGVQWIAAFVRFHRPFALSMYLKVVEILLRTSFIFNWQVGQRVARGLEKISTILRQPSNLQGVGWWPGTCKTFFVLWSNVVFKWKFHFGRVFGHDHNEIYFLYAFPS